MRPSSKSFPAVTILGIAAFLLFLQLGNKGFWNQHTETQRAEVSREMIASGDWVLPHMNGELYATKPPLAYWIMAVGIKLRGAVDEVAVRWPSALLAWITILAVYWLSRRLFGDVAAFYSAAALAVSPMWLWYGRQAGLDIHFAVFSSLSLLCFLAAEGMRPLFWLGALSFGLAVMTKGHIAVPLLGLPLAAAALDRKRLVPWNWKKIGLVALVALLIALPWVLMAYHRWPQITKVVETETEVNSFVVPESNRRPILYYLQVVPGLSPFLLVAIFSLARLWRERDARRVEWILWLAVLANIVFFSIFRQKKEYYLLPLVPWAAVAVGAWCARFVSGADDGRAQKVMAVVLSAVFLALGAGILYVAWKGFPEIGLKTGVTTILVAALGIQGLRALADGRRHQWLSAIVMTLAVVVAWQLFVFNPINDRFRSRKEFLLRARDVVGSKPLYLYDYSSYDVLYYLERTIPVATDEDLPGLLERPEQVYLLNARREGQEVRARGFHTALSQSYRSPMSRHAPRELWLLTNKIESAHPR